MRPESLRPHNGPGKFEGGTCIARFIYWDYLNGGGEDSECDCEKALRAANNGEYDESWDCDADCEFRVTSHVGPFTLASVEQYERDTCEEPLCQECLDALLKLDSVEIWEDEQGFVYSTA
jgi:hypothetical protein